VIAVKQNVDERVPCVLGTIICINVRVHRCVHYSIVNMTTKESQEQQRTVGISPRLDVDC